MEFIRGPINIQSRHQGCVVTLGNFDGVHLGHQAILTRLCDFAGEVKRPACLITFEPLPHEFFNPQEKTPRLTPLRDKLPLIEKIGIDFVLCLPFNHTLAKQSAKDFIQEVLVKKLKIRHFLGGNDVRFGHQREGDQALLSASGKTYGFTVEEVAPITHPCVKVRISSSLIRQQLATGQLAEAAQLLNRSYSLSGKVRHGDKRGRTLGFPTINLFLKQVSPLQGVYAVNLTGRSSSSRMSSR